MEKDIEENKLGFMPVGKLLATMSIPTIFSMLIQALYNIVDSIFVARYSETALTAVSLAFPLQNLMFSFAIGSSIGICSVISRRLGSKDITEANKSAETGYIIQLIFMIFFIVIGLFLSKPFSRIYTSDTELINMTSSYLSICLICSIGVFIGIYTEKTLQATGDTIHPMIIQASGAIFNIVADPILIFGYFGINPMGIKGAAYATVAGQIFSMILGLFFLKRNKYININILKAKFYKNNAADILKVGIPSIVMQGIGTIMTSLMNAILIVYNVLATTVFGVYFKLQSLVFMPVFGMNSGLMPILGFNYGSKNTIRIKKALKIAIISAFIFMLIGALVFILFPTPLLKLFNASEDMMSIGTIALRIIAPTFPLAAISIILGALFQAVGDGYLSMITSIVRQIFILIPSAWLLGKSFGLNAIWYSFLISEIFALTMSIIFYRVESKKNITYIEHI